MDVFKGDLAGLVLAEIELDTPSSPLPPFPPGMAIRGDVTDDPRFRNGNLVRMTPDEKAAIVRVAYASVLKSRSPRKRRL